MKRAERFRPAIIAVVAMGIGAAATLLLTSPRAGPPIVPQAPAPTVKQTAPLKGLNVFVFDDHTSERDALDAFVMDRGGQPMSTITADADFIVMGARGDDDRFKDAAQLARDLHIPVGTKAKLARMAESQRPNPNG